MLNYEIPYTFRSSPLPDFVLQLPKGDTRIMCRSFESWQRIIGINAAFILADEIDTVAKPMPPVAPVMMAFLFSNLIEKINKLFLFQLYL